MHREEKKHFKSWKKKNWFKNWISPQTLVWGALAVFFGAFCGLVATNTPKAEELSYGGMIVGIVTCILGLISVLRGDLKDDYKRQLKSAAETARKELGGYVTSERVLIKCRDSAIRMNNAVTLEKVYHHLYLLPQIALEFNHLRDAEKETSSEFEKEEYSQKILAISGVLAELEKQYEVEYQVLEDALREAEGKPSRVLSSLPNASLLAAEFEVRENENRESKIPRETERGSVIPFKKKNA